MNLISRFALLFVILEILYLLISGNLLSTSPFVITGNVLCQNPVHIENIDISVNSKQASEL
jgi:hypothetical protein